MYSELNHLRTFFYRRGIYIREADITPDSSIIYSARVEFGNFGLSKINLGCNGSGMSYLDALLSAYGELIERILNKGFFRSNYFIDNIILQSPSLEPTNQSELKVSIDSLSLDSRDILFEIFKTSKWEDIVMYLITLFNEEKIPCQLFLKVSDSTPVYLPYSLMQNFSSVNGMCAGKTEDEALVRGICEIIEKHYIWKIYTSDRIVLHTIPKEFYRDLFIGKYVYLLKELGYHLKFYYCESELDLPVIGILVVDLISNKYAFSISCHPHFETALKRSLIKIFKIDLGDKFQSLNFKESIDRKQNYFKAITDGACEWPFLNWHRSESFSVLKHFLQEDNAHKQLSYLYAQLLPKYEVYIRNNTKDDYIAYYVYIPHMSEIVFRMDINDFWKTQNLIVNAALIPMTGLSHFQIQSNDCDDLYKNDFRLGYMYQENSDLFNIPLEYLNAMVCIKNGEYDKAENFLQTFVSKEKRERVLGMPSAILLLDFLYGLKESRNISEVADFMNNFYPDQDIKMVKELFLYKKLPNMIQLPTCYNCQECPVKQKCHLMEVATLYKILYQNEDHEC